MLQYKCLNMTESRHQSYTNLPWTAARAQRLVRRLTTTLNCARRNAEKKLQFHSRVLERTREWPSKRLRRSNGTWQYAEHGEVSPTIPDTGNLDVPTPYLNRSFIAVDIDADTSDRPVAQEAPTVAKDKQQRRPTSSADKVSNAFQDHLKATADLTQPSPTRTSRKGARSLVEMCVRQIPVVIEHDEAYMHQMNPDENYDAASEMYRWLESEFEIVEGAGWRQFRVLARAHGVHLVHSAIHARTLNLENLLADSKTALIGEELLESFLLYLQRMDDPKVAETMEILINSLEDPAPFLFFGRLSRFLVVKQLPLAWLSGENFKRYWDLAILNISTPESSSVVDFLQYYLFNASQATSITAATANTINSLCTILATIAIVTASSNSEESMNSSNSTSNAALRSIRMAAIELERQEEPPMARQCAISLLVADLVCALLKIRVADENTDTVAKVRLRKLEVLTERTPHESPTLRQAAISFLHAVVRCCARAYKDADRAHLIFQGVVTRLSILADDQLVDGPSFATRLALEAWADAPGAESILAHLYMPPAKPASDAHKVGPEIPGYRWEHGIGEWVTATPALQRKATIGVVSMPTTPSATLLRGKRHFPYTDDNISSDILAKSSYEYVSSPKTPVIARSGTTTQDFAFDYNDNLSSDILQATPHSIMAFRLAPVVEEDVTPKAPASLQVRKNANSENPSTMSAPTLTESTPTKPLRAQSSHQGGSKASSTNRTVRLLLHYTEDKENHEPSTDAKHSEEDVDELSITHSPGMQARAVAKRPLQPRAAAVPVEEDDGDDDELL